MRKRGRRTTAEKWWLQSYCLCLTGRDTGRKFSQTAVWHSAWTARPCVTRRHALSFLKHCFFFFIWHDSKVRSWLTESIIKLGEIRGSRCHKCTTLRRQVIKLVSRRKKGFTTPRFFPRFIPNYFFLCLWKVLVHVSSKESQKENGVRRRNIDLETEQSRNRQSIICI